MTSMDTLHSVCLWLEESWNENIFWKKIKTFECGGVMALVSTAELDFNDSEVVSLRTGAQK